MPVNRNALIRYRTINNCLKNRQKRWTLEDLIDACSEALYDYEGIDKGVSRRSIQMDIQLMRSDKLGYNAPIIVLEKKYYTYEDADYSITNIPLTDQDLGKLTEVVEILRQFKGFSHFQELSGMVQKLESKVYSAKTKQEPVIDFEKNENLKGLEHIEILYQAIINKKALEFSYQSFKARSANSFTFHPYYLKEYRNRWFVLGVKNNRSPLMNLALDRIVLIHDSTSTYCQPKGFNMAELFKDVIGVTFNQASNPEKVVLFADNETAPYIATKPIHHSQQVVETLPNGVVFSINVQLNFELEREILGFGDRIKVIAPERLKRRIKETFENALDQYQYELSNYTLQNILKKVEYKGFAILNYVFGKKEADHIKGTIHNFLKSNPQEEPYAIRNLLEKIPAISSLILNSNLLNVLKNIDRNLFLTKAIFFDKSPDANWYVTWHQDTIINVKEKIETEGFTGWTKKEDGYGVCPPTEILKNTITIRIHLDDTDDQNGALKILPGSHQKKMMSSEIQLIAQSSIPFVCDVNMGGIHIMKPLLLHASSKATSQKHRRVLHLEFNTMELPNGMEWSEKQMVL
jgi:predicted DNA-binding transcriptional regulator YafY